jgi:hypothetical protein
MAPRTAQMEEVPYCRFRTFRKPASHSCLRYQGRYPDESIARWSTARRLSRQRFASKVGPRRMLSASLLGASRSALAVAQPLPSGLDLDVISRGFPPIGG